MNIVNFSFDPRKYTFWSGITGGFPLHWLILLTNLRLDVIYPGRSVRESQMGLIMNGWAAKVPVQFFIFY
jgi:hypothetical protein